MEFQSIFVRHREIQGDADRHQSGKVQEVRKCENECLAGAIHVQDRAVIDFSRCLHCYPCTQACKFGAVETSIHEKLDWNDSDEQKDPRHGEPA